jgi:hypothetical protein
LRCAATDAETNANAPINASARLLRLNIIRCSCQWKWNLGREHSYSAYFDNAIVTSGMVGVTSRVQRWSGEYDLDSHQIFLNRA